MHRPTPPPIAIILVAAALSASVAVAGPTLEDALQRERTDDGALSEPPPPASSLEVSLASDSLAGRQPHLMAPRQGGYSGVRLDLGLLDGPSVRLRLGVGVRADAPRTLYFEGSQASWVLESSELYASVERRHWGPGRAGSLILDGAASALPAVGWRRPTLRASSSPWLSWLGPWRGDLFVGRLNGHRQPHRPTLIGMRIEAQPWQRLRVGASRTLQWGGRGRPENADTLLHALAGIDNGGDRATEPGNQLAGIDWRWTLWPRQDLGWYGQVIGEDEAGMLPSRNFWLSGVDLRHRFDGGGTLRMFVEWTNTRAGSLSDRVAPGATYRHHLYPQGYTHDGALLGHPVGGDVVAAAAGALVERGPFAASAVLARGRATSDAQRFVPGRLEAVNANLQVDLGDGHRTGVGAWWLRSAGWRGASAQWWWQYAWP
jgi:hypothetical protein